MELAELIRGLDADRVSGDPGVEIASLAYDDRRVGPGTLFFCVRGERRDGHDFGQAAVEAGAAALVVERQLELAVPQVVVADSRTAMAPLAARFWGEPTRELGVVGVTGTNGKTTTAFLIREIFEAAGIRCGLLGTVKQVVGGAEEEVERTTPEAIDLQATFRRMVEAGDRACAMEVSSHALALHRCDAIEFDVAVFTNLTQDHLDFHADMEDYFGAKRLLFEMGPGASVINADDPYGRRLAADLDCLTFSADGAPADLSAGDVRFDAGGAAFTVSISPTGRKRLDIQRNRPVDAKWEVEVRTPLPGHFNVANALGAIGAAGALGVEPDAAARALATADPVPGRFEPVDEGQDFAVVVDYAHTPDSLQNVLEAARRLTDGKLIAVFGAGGDRDREKRPLMGRVAADLADLAIVTSDNPRSEEPEAIVAEVVAGIEPGAVSEVEVDRRAAIALAFRRARPGDMVVIAGKGHEQGQELAGGRKVPFDDRDVAREELRKLGSPA